MLTTSHLAGSPNWLDLASPDVDASAGFYGEVFGWTVEPGGPDPEGLRLLRLHGRTAAAVRPLAEYDTGPSWTVYFSTPDVDATIAAAREVGGTVRAGPADAPGGSLTAALTDPTGADFALWQPGDVLGLDVVSEPNALCWVELYTTDAEAAGAFYRALFSWALHPAPMAEVEYSVLAPFGGGVEDGFGGLFELPGEERDVGSGPEWHPYVAVTDCDGALNAAVKQGAATLVPPMDLPDVGRMAMFADPVGAVCALITPQSPE
ncbi:VOC family protein [Streptomyces alkaliterrae]|uniref:VOC family protein n=1 Tax=Streptomyces alkaliterrae TaxID=2213162 RepID=A0A5P0YW44_9ACTN|nr:VOC family protein [Streptomyces alkaliterrae]MBB1255811.1 VOC family protein [Streptomyces alkaliterrae]MBB1261841.1 VOC family protein [Streptomyces alkaliterrae]MQS04508.1 VOC family protein [Streptomyces alkaliterrae]